MVRMRESPIDGSSALRDPVEDVDLASVRGDSLRFLEARAAAAPDGFCYRVDGETVHVVNHPETVAAVLRGDGRAFTKERTPDHYMLGPVLGEGLLTSSGQVWGRQRRALAPLFRRTRVRSLDALVVAAAEHTVEGWLAAGTTPARRDHDLSSLTLTVLVGGLLGPDSSRVGPGFGAAVDDINHYLGAFGGPEGSADARVRDGYARAVGLVRGISAALLDAFTRRPDEAALLGDLSDPDRAGWGDGAEGADAGSLLDQVVTLVMAGHETTAKALCWALLLLADHPDIHAQVRAEICGRAADRPLRATDLPGLPYTQAFVREVLRLYPPIWLMSRRAARPVRVGSAVATPADLVCISPWLLHRDPRWWDEPERCRPERFLGPEPRPFTYLPFGGGERICIGQHLALLETVLALGTIVRSCDVVRTGPQPRPEALVTLRPDDGCVLAVHPATDRTAAAR